MPVAKREIRKKVLPYWKKMIRARVDFYAIVRSIEQDMQKNVGEEYEFAYNDDGVYFGIGKVRKNGTRKCVLHDTELGGL